MNENDQCWITGHGFQEVDSIEKAIGILTRDNLDVFSGIRDRRRTEAKYFSGRTGEGSEQGSGTGFWQAADQC
ncbi:hypothetical protein CQ016_16110 [Arthrobacter sp. MYb222]|nr:hypothetical protein CQ016_16110 [Arthrobacter sp. MYb222]